MRNYSHIRWIIEDLTSSMSFLITIHVLYFLSKYRQFIYEEKR